MDGNLSEMLKGVLSDPDAMEKIKNAADMFMGGNTPKDTRSDNGNDDTRSKEATGSDQTSHTTKFDQRSNDQRIALISALRPYLSPERRQTADTLIKMLKVIKLTDISKLLKE